MKTLVGAFNQEKALVGAFSVIVHLRRLIVYSTNIAGAHPMVCWVSRLKRKAEVKSRTFSTHFWWPAAVRGSRSPWRRAMRYLQYRVISYWP